MQGGKISPGGIPHELGGTSLSALPSAAPAWRSRALAWWWAAFAVVAVRLAGPRLLAVLPGRQAGGGGCAWFAGETAEPWKWELSGLLSEVQAWVAMGLPVVVALGAWLVAARGERGWARIWAALAVVGAVAVDYALLVGQLRLGWTPEGADCTAAPDAVHAVSAGQLGWTFAPAVLALAGAWEAGRAPREHSPGVSPWPASRWSASWWPVSTAAVLGVVAVLVAAGTLRLPPGEPEQSLAPDGTPRHTLAIIGDRLAVLDLVEGGGPRMLAAPDPAFFQYTAITRDTRPGGYLAAVSTAGDGAFGGRSSRLYRIVMDGDGGAAVGEQVGGDLAGMVLDLAVSPRGEIAYSRVVAVPGDTLSVATTFVGLVAPRREWSATGAHGAGRAHTGPLGLHWRDAGTLAFHAVPPQDRATQNRAAQDRATQDGAAQEQAAQAGVGRGGAGRVLALDVTRPGSDLLAARELHALAAGGDGLGLGVPGSAALAVSWAGDHTWHDHRIAIVEPGARERPVFASGGATLQTFTLDRSGRHLLVSLAGARARGASYELVRVDLRTAGGAARVVWQSEHSMSTLAW